MKDFQNTVPWIVFGISILLTILIWHSFDSFVKEKTSERFEISTEKVVDAVYERMINYEQIIISGRGFFEGSLNVERYEWDNFVAIQNIGERFPGMQVFGYITKVEKDNLQSFLEYTRLELPDYSIKPEGDRNEYYPVLYLYPLDERNKHALGYDIYSETIRRNSADLAIDSGQTTMTGKVKLVQETDEKNPQPGFLILYPLYEKEKPHDTIEQRRESLQGFVYGGYRTYDFMEGIINEISEDICFQIFDGEPIQENLLYDLGIVKDLSSDDLDPNYTTTKKISVHGRE